MLRQKLLLIALLAVFVVPGTAWSATLAFYPETSTLTFDTAGNLAFALVPAEVSSSATACRLGFYVATRAAALKSGKIKSASSSPEGTSRLFQVAMPAGNPNAPLVVTTIGLSVKIKKDKKGYVRAAVVCGKKKKSYVFSPTVAVDTSAIAAATAKSAAQVAQQWKTKTTTSF